MIKGGDNNARFYAFCWFHKLNPSLMRRPLMWWLDYRDEWKPEWQESEVPFGQRPNMRNRDGTLATDPRIPTPHYTGVE